MKKNKNKNLYLSDKPPLTLSGKIGLAISYLVLIIWSLFIILPLSQMIISSFNGNQGRNIIMNTEFVFSFKNFEFLFKETEYLTWVINTIVIAIATTLVTLVVVSLTGYAYSRFRFKGKKGSLMAIMLIQVIPSFIGITAYFTIQSIIESKIPGFSRQAMLVLIYAAGGIASNTFILKGYIDSISPELDEAAKIDGCSNLQVYRLIIMPVARPMLAIISLWSFIGPFMDYLISKILLTSPETYTLAVGLFTLVNDERKMNQPAFAAGGLLTAIPIVLLFIVLQKQLVSGLSSGSVKG